MLAGLHSLYLFSAQRLYNKNDAGDNSNAQNTNQDELQGF